MPECVSFEQTALEPSHELRLTGVLLPSPPAIKKPPEGGLYMAGGEGFEPPLAESESAVLPLDEPPGNLGIA